MKKLFTYSLVCISIFFGIHTATAQTKQGHPFSAKELTKLQTVQKAGTKIKKAPGAVTASNKTFNMDSIAFWVGSGSKQAAMGIQWKNADGTDAPVMVWGYRWENEAEGTGEQMLRAIAKQDARLYVLLMGSTQYGVAVGGLGYDRDFNGNVGLTKSGVNLYPEDGILSPSGNYNFDGWELLDADDYWFGGWNNGFLTYMIRADFTSEFNGSHVGATSRTLTDGCWDLWVANPDFSWISDESINSKFIASTATPNYSQGTFFVNEDWFGHNNSTVNFLSNDGDWTYRVFQKENSGHELGATAPFGTIYGGKMYIVSKQDKDGGASIQGSRLAVADAVTMKVKAEFPTIGGADGRSFLGVDENTGYIGTSGGIYLFDINNLTVGNKIEGTSGEGGPYNGQVGTMLRVGNRVFAVLQNKGILVINALTNTLETTINGKYGSIVMSKDGNVWASTDETANSGKTLVKINPYTLETENRILPNEASIPNSWYAWTADGFCASKQTNTLYWKNNGGWMPSKKIYKLDLDDPSAEPVVVYESTDDWGLYGAGFRISPETDHIYASMFKGFGDQSYKVIQINAVDGEVLREYEMEKHYWFPAMPVFPDNYGPVIDNTQLGKISFKNDTAIYLGDKITDKDNFDKAIVKSFSVDNPDLVDVKISGDSLTLKSKGTLGTTKLTLKANSNGKLVSTTLNVNVIAVPEITTQPTAQDVVVGEIATFTVEAIGGDLAYQWYRDDALINNATSSMYSIVTKLEDNGAQFHCVVKNSAGEVVSEKVLFTARLIVPEITEQPVSLVKAENAFASFSITARGGNLRYQWYKDDEPISGATSATYSILFEQLLKDKNGTYHCVVTNDAGVMASEKVTLTVLAKAVITTQPVAGSATVGDDVTLSVVAEGDNLTYQWYKSATAPSGIAQQAPTASEPIDGATESSLSIPNAQESDSGEYHCIVKNEVSSVESSKVSLVVSKPTGLTDNKQSIILVSPNPATHVVSVSADGYLSIYSAAGVKVYENTNYTAGTQINVSSWTNGVYVAKINNKTMKFIKQ